MKPLNLDNNSCNPISSNCVTWQGPNIPCIKLCSGDTITDVVHALATQLCTILDQVNISTLDLSCLNITTGKPSNLNQLLQILIDKICELNNVPATTTPKRGNSSCPTDCIVPVAACLQTGGQTTMKLLDYVQLIGNTICSLLSSISTINTSITNLATRVTALEATPATPPYVLPSFVPDCTLANGTVDAGVSYQLDAILTALVNDDNHGYCALLSNTGEPEDIHQAYISQTVNGADGALSNCYQTLNQLYDTTWINTPQNLSQSFIDLWLVVKDIRDAYKRYNVVSGSSNVTVTPTTTPGTCGPEISYAISVEASADPEIIVEDTSAIDMSVVRLMPANQWQIKAAVKDTGWHYLLGFSQYTDSSSVARPQARRVGNIIYFRGVIQIPMGNEELGQSGTALAITEPDALADYAYCNVLDQAYTTDPNACSLYAGASVIGNGGSKTRSTQLRFARGGNVLPPEVLSGGTTIDNTFTQGNTSIMYRAITFDGATSGVFLSSTVGVFVGTNSGGGCILGITSLMGNENYSGDFLNYSSKVRMMVSRVKQGEVIPLYDSQLAGTEDKDTSNATTVGAAYAPNLVGNFSNYTWPFSCDAANAAQLGGFRFRLDGLMAFLAPCNTGTSTLTTC
jgi:hypothetical protein